MKNHTAQWEQIKTAWVHQRMSQSMLFVGPLHCALDDFAMQTIKLILCTKKNHEPCLDCNDCQMVDRREHPDMEWIHSEKIGGVIKIDQIRDLQQGAYLTPQRAMHRVIVIEAAEKMNNAAANALLKILEEPSRHTIFILMAQQIATVLPTVLSRCRIIRFSSSFDSHTQNLLGLGEHYPQESGYALIVKQSEPILDGLIALLESREHPCVLASSWTQYEPNTLLWFLYLVFAQLQRMHFSSFVPAGPAIGQLIRLSSLLNPTLIFKQLNTINTLLKKLSHNMNINHTLALEDLLLAIMDNSA